MNNLTTFLRRTSRNLFAAHEVAGFIEVEREERIFYLRYLREGMIVFDVGANIGELTLLFSRLVTNGKVHAFEASLSTFKRLETIIHTAQKSNVVLNHLALSNQNGNIRLNVYDDSLSAFNSQAVRPMKDYGLDIEPISIEEIPATTVDQYCESNGIGKIDLLKIDIEGAELQVMQGAKRMLDSRLIGCLTFEFGQTTFDMGNRPEEIEALLNGSGYKIRNIVKGDPNFPGRKCVETARYSMHVATPDRR